MVHSATGGRECKREDEMLDAFRYGEGGGRRREDEMLEGLLIICRHSLAKKREGAIFESIRNFG